MMEILRAFTNIGDSSITISISVFMIAFLLITRRYSLSLSWAASVLACCFAMSLLKLGFYSCGYIVKNIIVSPSGHAALSATVYGALAATLSNQRHLNIKIISFIFAGVVVVCIAISRIVLNYHNTYEVIIGLTIGSIIAIKFTFISRCTYYIISMRDLAMIASAVMVIVSFTYGSHWQIEYLFRSFIPSIRSIACANT